MKPWSVVFLLFISLTLHAEISEGLAVRAIVGEAADQTPEVKLGGCLCPSQSGFLGWCVRLAQRGHDRQAARVGV